MALRLLPRSGPGRLALLGMTPVLGIVFGVALAGRSAAQRGELSLVLMGAFFLAQLLFLAWRMRVLEDQLAALKRPGKPSLFAHTARSTFSAGIIFATGFSMTFVVATTIFPKAAYWLVILLCCYVASAVGLVAGFLLSASDQLMIWRFPR